MRRKRMRLVSLISSAVCLLGCAVQPAPVSDSPESNTKVSAYAASQAEQNEEECTVAESLLPQTEDGGDTSESSVALLPHPHRHLHRNRQRNRGSNLRLSPNLPLRLSLPPAGISIPSRRPCGRATSMRRCSAA